jgi:hypothetical protein
MGLTASGPDSANDCNTKGCVLIEREFDFSSNVVEWGGGALEHVVDEG